MRLSSIFTFLGTLSTAISFSTPATAAPSASKVDREFRKVIRLAERCNAGNQNSCLQSLTQLSRALGFAKQHCATNNEPAAAQAQKTWTAQCIAWQRFAKEYIGGMTVKP